jgi:uncharacterized cupin superfamily protein
MASNRIINVADVPLTPHAHGERFAAKDGGASEAVGARLLGYSVTEVPPGKRAWPFHNHNVNEELFVILEGHGTVRIGPDTFPIKQGDLIACPPGGPDTAHQIINTSDGPLRYLSVSTMLPQEIVEYPDSGKVMMYAYRKDGAAEPTVTFRHRGRLGDKVDYWEGE